MALASGRGFTLGGLPIPFHGGLLVGLVALHVALGLGAVVTGAVAMLSRKAEGRHPRMGAAYFWCLAGVCASMAVLALERWPADIHLMMLGVLAFASALTGRAARRRRIAAWVRWHVGGMGSSYVLMLTAFYVDNGPHLPIWDRLPQVVYWTLPALIGAPLIIRAIRRYRHFEAAPVA